MSVLNANTPERQQLRERLVGSLQVCCIYVCGVVFVSVSTFVRSKSNHRFSIVTFQEVGRICTKVIELACFTSVDCSWIVFCSWSHFEKLNSTDPCVYLCESSFFCFCTDSFSRGGTRTKSSENNKTETSFSRSIEWITLQQWALKTIEPRHLFHTRPNKFYSPSRLCCTSVFMRGSFSRFCSRQTRSMQLQTLYWRCNMLTTHSHRHGTLQIESITLYISTHCERESNKNKKTKKKSDKQSQRERETYVQNNRREMQKKRNKDQEKQRYFTVVKTKK